MGGQVRLTKKRLVELLEHYDDNTNIMFGVELQQGYVGFFDIEEDTVPDREECILRSRALNEWYWEDMNEARE